ncbi:MAG: hypothetical protein ABI823_00265 [Bryobacteraceae bacterium]
MPLLFLALGLAFQSPQNPSPMTEDVRANTRIVEQDVAGRRMPLSIGRLLIHGSAKRMPLVVHFHGPPWVAEQAASGRWKNVAVIAVDVGSGSGAYERTFAEPGRFAALLKEARQASGIEFSRLTLTSWSAGYGAVRAILRDGFKPDAVLLMDSLHAGYVTEGKPGPVLKDDLRPFVEYARKGHLVMTHSEVFPGTFASTTEAIDDLLRDLGLRHHPVLKWGPLGMQEISEIKNDRVLVMGFAGNSAPDHEDHLFAMGDWLKLLK